MPTRSKIPHTIRDANLLRSMARRRNVQLSTDSRAGNTHSESGVSTSVETIGVPGVEKASASRPVHGRKLEIPVENTDKPSTDLRPKPKGIIRKIKNFPGYLRRLWHLVRPPLTAEQLEQKAAYELEQRRDKLCIREARVYGRYASGKMAQLGLRELQNSPDPNKPKKLKMCKWDAVARDDLFTKIVMHLNTNPTSLPHYVRVSELGRNPLYSDEMLPTLHHYVQFDSDDFGVTMTVFRQGLDGLPDYIAADDIWKKCPENKPALTFPVGYAENSRKVFVDLDDCPHLIVSGATKQGKSNFINDLLCFWLYRGLKPTELQLVLFDLKRGMEFVFYEGLPHLYVDTPGDVAGSPVWDTEHPIENGIVQELKDVMPTMERLREIMDSRLTRIKNAGFKDFNGYNRGITIKSRRLPALVIVFDEWAKIRLNRAIGLNAETLLAELTNLARAAGMYFIVGTQNPNREVLSPLISVNFSTRVVFKCSIGGSLAALGNQSAHSLEVKGRAILLDGGEEIKLQTARISDSLIRAMVYKAITGKDIKSSDTDLEEIMQYALDYLDGYLDSTKLFEIFRTKRVSQRWLLKALRDAEGNEFVLSGTPYKVNGRGSRTPRQLVRLDV